MGKGNYGVLATRNPMPLLPSAGVTLPRYDARQKKDSLSQLPPRTTRSLPLPGPVGFVCEPDA